MILTSENFSPLQIWISPRNQVQIRWFLIPWIRFEVIFLNPPFSLISHLNSSSNLTKLQKISRKYLNSLWIRPLFTIIPFNSLLIPQISKFGLIFNAIPREIDDLAVSSRHVAYKPITLPCIWFKFIEMKFIHCHSCVMFVMKSTSICND